MGWEDQALCRYVNPDLFFPGTPENDPRSRKQYIIAREICDECPVRHECLAHALKHRIPDGMWGGRTPSQRGVRVWSRSAS